MSTIVSAENKFVNNYEIDIGAAGLLSINGSSRLDKLKIKMQMYRDLFSAFKVVKTKTTCKNIKKSKTIFFTILMQFKAEKSSVLVFNRFFFFQKRLIRFINGLKIKSFCRSLTNFSVNLKKTSVPLTELCTAVIIILHLHYSLNSMHGLKTYNITKTWKLK